MSSVSPDDHSRPAVDIRSLVHELRQPLCTIEACTSLLRIYLEETEDARLKECLDSIDNQVEAIDRILVQVTSGTLSPRAAV